MVVAALPDTSQQGLLTSERAGRSPPGQEGGIMQRVRVFRCVICGRPNIGFERPTNCPFCGAHEKYMVHSADWRDTDRVKFTEDSRKNLEAALELEVGCAEFYLCASRKSAIEEMRAMFWTLSRAEREHASVISRILERESPTISSSRDMCPGDDRETLEEANRRENRAVKLYTEFLKRASEPRVSQLFTALVEIESDHIDLVNKDLVEEEGERKQREDIPGEGDLKRLDRDETDFYDAYKIHED